MPHSFTFRITTTRRYLLLIALLLFNLVCRAQVKPDPSLPHDIKVIEEYKDASGNTVRTIQYYQGGRRITETQRITPSLNLHAPINPDTLNRDSLLVVVNKSKFVVDVVYRRRKIRSYKAVFGPKPLENKKMAGDRHTPEGSFKILNKNPASKYDKFLLLDYPNDSAKAKFNRLKMAGTIPQNATIGSDVGIHGVWKGGDDMIEMGVGWTDGCVALKNKDIEDLFSIVGVGTRVLIRK
jgi:murein L,D-transpeptidase YafK